MTQLIPPHSLVQYHSMHGVLQTGIVVGYGYVGSVNEPDVYLIEIGRDEVYLPLQKMVAKETWSVTRVAG